MTEPAANRQKTRRGIRVPDIAVAGGFGAEYLITGIGQIVGSLAHVVHAHVKVGDGFGAEGIGLVEVAVIGSQREFDHDIGSIDITEIG